MYMLRRYVYDFAHQFRIVGRQHGAYQAFRGKPRRFHVCEDRVYHRVGQWGHDNGLRNGLLHRAASFYIRG
jgi:hypothetical protein